MGVLLVAGSGVSFTWGESLGPLMINLLAKELDDSLCGEIGTSCNSSNWNTTC